MKKIVSLILILTLALSSVAVLSSCGETNSYTVGICQLMDHDMLNQATEGFMDQLTKEMEAKGKTVTFDLQIAGDANTCPTVINVFKSKNVNLIMANATPALSSAAAAVENIPILGTSVTDYNDTFKNGIPDNVSGTSDAVPFEDQAQIMIDTLGLVAGDKVGVIYCSAESNSQYQYEKVKEYFESKSIVVTPYTFSDPNDLQAVANTAANNSKAIYVPSDNTVSTYQNLVDSACRAKDIPVFTSYGGDICYCSLAIDYYQLGVETGKMAAKIHLGEADVSELEIGYDPEPDKFYNKDVCEEIGIDISALEALGFTEAK